MTRFATLVAIAASMLSLGALGQSATTPLSPAAAVGQSSEHACALDYNSYVYCWGRNTRGQLGDGSVNDRSIAARVVGLPPVVGYALGGYTEGSASLFPQRYAHTCARISLGSLADQKVQCWGGNESGQLGDGTTTDRLFPVDVSGLPTNLSQIVAGGRHTCALTSDGAVKCWGLNDAGQLGDGTNISRSTPVAVVGLSSGVVGITAGYKHTCALMGPGSLNADRIKCWGSNNTGQLGDGTRIDRAVPTDVVGLPPGSFVNLTAGGGDKDSIGRDAGSETCMLTSQLRPFCWGHNTLTPTERGGDPVFTLSPRRGNATSFPPGCHFSSCAQFTSRSCGIRLSDRKLLCWDFHDDTLFRSGTLSASGINTHSTGEGYSACAAVGATETSPAQSVVCYRGDEGALEASSYTVMRTASDLNPQSITFGNVAPTTIANVGDSVTLTINAGGSGNPVTLASTTPAICSVSGNTVTGLAQGKCIITADQAGNSQYEAAPQATLVLRVGDPLPQTITFGAAPTVVVGGSGTVGATATSGLPVTFTSDTTFNCNVSGNVVSGRFEGTCIIAAKQSGDFFFAPAQATQTFPIGVGPSAEHSLLVNIFGSNGRVTSSPAAIDCFVSTCAASIASGTGITLSAHVAAGTGGFGEIFSGFSGDCSGFTCSLAMNTNYAVNATFTTYMGTLKPRMRLYNPTTFEHLYTSNALEYAYLSNQIDPACCGWQPEGTVYNLFDGPGQVFDVQAVPLRRLYNPSSHQHHWTTELTEYNFLGSVGWQQEGIDQYILPTQAPGTIALYRLYNSSNGGLHLWTTDAAEAAYLTANAGWANEGVAGYVIPLQP